MNTGQGIATHSPALPNLRRNGASGLRARNRKGADIMRSIAALCLITWLGVFSPRTQAAGLPLVISATVDYTHNTLTISGQNFGSVPAV